MSTEFAVTEQEVKDGIHYLLDTSDKAVERALLVIYANQTDDEKATDSTRHHNGRGFAGRDAAFMSQMAKDLQRFGGLTDRKILFVRKNLYKYWRQLWDAAKANGRPIKKAPAGYTSEFRNLTTVADVFKYEQRRAA